MLCDAFTEFKHIVKILECKCWSNLNLYLIEMQFDTTGNVIPENIMNKEHIGTEISPNTMRFALEMFFVFNIAK